MMTETVLMMMDDKPKLLNSKGIYFPSDVMANILSYLPTPLDHHKKQMKIVNEDFNIIKEYYYCYTSYDTDELYWYLDYKGNNRRLRKSPKRRSEYLSIKTKWDMKIEDHRA